MSALALPAAASQAVPGSGVLDDRVVTRQYDVFRDGRRFLMVRAVERPPLKVIQMILVQNWLEELKQRVPTR
jgi:hypothetical protein